MLTPSDFHSYQERGVEYGIQIPELMLLLDVGLGKSVIGLTIIAELYDRAEIMGCLIIAPLRVCQAVWRQEARKWTQTKHLTFQLVHGSIKERRVALRRRADIYLINYEGLPWLVEELNTNWYPMGQRPPFDMFIFDEVSRMANPEARRSRLIHALYRTEWINRRVGLTATPATNGLGKLFGEYKILDEGKALGLNKKGFADRYFYYNDHTRRQEPKPRAKERIFLQTREITFAVSGDDFLDVPATISQHVEVTFTPKIQAIYDDLEEEFLAQLPEGEVVEVFNAAAKMNKLLQFTGGQVYVDDPDDLSPSRSQEREFSVVHDLKLEAVDEIIESAEGAPVVVGYAFRMERRRLRERYQKHYRIKDVHDYKDAAELLIDFKAGKIDILTGHPASMGHGIDGLQHCCNHLIRLSLVWDLELDMQLIGRLARQGQTKPVVVHTVIVKDTIDELVLSALEGKRAIQTEFLTTMRQYSAARNSRIINQLGNAA